MTSKNTRHYTSINATWIPEGGVFRKWISTGTADYDYKAYSSSSFVPPRFYAQSGTRVALLSPAELHAGHEHTKVVGRLLPRFAATSAQNIDLMAEMKLGAGSSLQLSASNPSSAESFNAARLKEYSVSPALNLTKHQGIGMFVEGDGSGGTLVVSVICGRTMGPRDLGRDYAVPLTFSGKQWVEIPSAEQGLRSQTWGPIGHATTIWAGIDYSHVIG